jgi:hypothetical protein
VEVCGSEKFDYDYRRKIFDKNDYNVIFLHLYKEKDKWIYHLNVYLEKIMDYRDQKLNEVITRENCIKMLITQFFSFSKLFYFRNKFAFRAFL